jgi:hypothetical protein
MCRWNPYYYCKLLLDSINCIAPEMSLHLIVVYMRRAEWLELQRSRLHTATQER